MKLDTSKNILRYITIISTGIFINILSTNCYITPTIEKATNLPQLRFVNIATNLGPAQFWCLKEDINTFGKKVLKEWVPSRNQVLIYSDGSTDYQLPLVDFSENSGYGFTSNLSGLVGDIGPCYYEADDKLTDPFVYDYTITGNEPSTFISKNSAELIRFGFDVSADTYYTVMLFGTYNFVGQRPKDTLIMTNGPSQIPKDGFARLRILNFVPDVIGTINAKYSVTGSVGTESITVRDIFYGSTGKGYDTFPAGEIATGAFILEEDARISTTDIYSNPAPITFKSGGLYTILIVGYQDPLIDPDISNLADPTAEVNAKSLRIMLLEDNPG